MTQEPYDLDLGDNHTLTYAPFGGIEKHGAIIGHQKPDGSACRCYINFDTPEIRATYVDPREAKFWQVGSWDPLTLSPSILCMICGDHGYIRGGKWVKS